jgi:hypothetical protein
MRGCGDMAHMWFWLWKRTEGRRSALLPRGRMNAGLLGPPPSAKEAGRERRGGVGEWMVYGTLVLGPWAGVPLDSTRLDSTRSGFRFGLHMTGGLRPVRLDVCRRNTCIIIPRDSPVYQNTMTDSMVGVFFGFWSEDRSRGIIVV